MTPEWTAPAAADADLPIGGPRAVDAYLVWDRLTGQARHPAGNAWPVIVQLAAGESTAGDRLSAWLHTLPAEADRQRWQQAFAASLALAPHSAYQTALLPEGCEGQLLQAVQAGHLLRFQLGARCTQRGPVAPEALSQRLGEGPAPQVLGVIDDGCCFAHEHFRSAAGCRVRALWDQDPAAQPVSGWRAPAPGGGGYGVELLQAELDAAIANFPTLGEMGERAERALYAALARPRWGLPSRMHGARVMHLLAGRRGTPGAAPDAGQMPVIFVQLPTQTVGDTSGDSLGMHVLDGARYIVARARQLDVAAEVTINISLGSVAGPHDGSSLAERALTELASDPKVRIVMAAGNTAGPESRLHAQQVVARGTPGRFVVRAHSALQRDSFVELWIDADAADALALRVVAPGGQRSDWIGVGQLTALRGAGRQVLAALSVVRRPAQGERGAMALLSLATTDGIGSRMPAPAGFWSIEVESQRATPTVVHGWVERDDTVIGARRPQQMRFETAIGQADDGSVNDDMTLSNLSNAEGLVVVGGYVQSAMRVAAYSANGPRRGGQAGDPTHYPNHYAPSDRSHWLRGIAVPGFFSGTHSAISGTSAAAPQVARTLAEGGVMAEIPPDAVGNSSPQAAKHLRPTRVDRALAPGTRWLL